MQHFVVDVFACCELNNFNWIRQNQQRLRVDCYKNLMNRIDEDAELTDIDIKTSIFFFNFTNDFRYIKIKKQNVLILIRRFEKSTFFITFTCNFKWFEFERDLFAEISIKNRFDFTARMFQLKLKKLFRNFTDRHVLKKIKTHFYVIKFQKRDFFHAHIFIINHFMNDVILTNVDDVIQAIIFKVSTIDVFAHCSKKRLYEIVKINMIHKNCKIETQCKNAENNCIKRFSKRLQIVSNLNNFSNYSYYRRIDDNNVSKTCWNNSMIVFYNVYFLLKFNVHINVEICTSIKLIVYLYKYVFKNSNFVNVEIIITKKINRFVYASDSISIVDECTTYHENK